MFAYIGKIFQEAIITGNPFNFVLKKIFYQINSQAIFAGQHFIFLCIVTFDY